MIGCEGHRHRFSHAEISIHRTNIKGSEILMIGCKGRIWSGTDIGGFTCKGAIEPSFACCVVFQIVDDTIIFQRTDRA